MKKLLIAVLLGTSTFALAAPAFADDEKKEEKRPEVAERTKTNYHDPVTKTFCTLWNGDCTVTPKKKKDEEDDEEVDAEDDDTKTPERDPKKNPKGQPETMPSPA